MFERPEAPQPPLDRLQAGRQVVVLEDVVVAREQEGQDLAGAGDERDPLPTVLRLVARETPVEDIDLRLQRDVLAVQAHRLRLDAVPRQPADAVHDRDQQVVEEKLRRAEGEGEHARDRHRAPRDVKGPRPTDPEAGSTDCASCPA